jgi:hypothetical protein
LHKSHYIEKSRKDEGYEFDGESSLNHGVVQRDR